MTTTTAELQEKEKRSLWRHPALWLCAFFGVLVVLETIFFTVAGSLPDDRLEPGAVVPARASAVAGSGEAGER